MMSTEHVGNHRDDTVGEPPLLPQNPHTSMTKEPNYAMLHQYFGWLPMEYIKKTLENMMQYGRIPMGTHLKSFYKSPNPALNIPRCSEPVACDIIYADTPAIDDGSTAAIIFVGCHMAVKDVYGIKTNKQFINTLEDHIREHGAPNKLISDHAQVKNSNKVLGILQTLFISSWQSEPHQQHQNPAE